jgi:hypothetical protein
MRKVTNTIRSGEEIGRREENNAKVIVIVAPAPRIAANSEARITNFRRIRSDLDSQ